ncbi:MAG: AraC family transcriptional regulator [Armatimonadota bacterium]
MIKSWNGCSWTPPPHMAPALCSAIEIVRVNPRPTGRIVQDTWVLECNFSEGELVRVSSPNQPWRSRPAHVVHLYPPGLPYWEAPGPGGATFISHCAYVQFIDRGALGLERLLTAAGYARFVDERCAVGGLLSRMAAIGTAEREDGYWHAHALFFRIISLLQHAAYLGGETYRVTGDAPATGSSDFVQSVRTFMHERLADPLTLADIARHLGVSCSTLSHRYRTETGEAPMQALKRMRIHLARVLLAKGYQLKEVARQVGLCDEFYLSKSFKQLEGVSPRAFRERVRAAGIETPGPLHEEENNGG